MAQPILVQATRIFVVDIVGGVFGFPVWWYTKGVARWTQFMWRWYGGYRQQLAVGVWIKNIFVPMYGSYDIAGRLISFFMRMAMIVIRTSLMLLVTLLFAVGYLLYFLAPLAVVAGVLYHGLGLVT